jgi:TonB family protein
MKTITRATVAAIAVLCVRPVVAVGQEAGFQPLDSWVAEPGARTSNQGDVLVIQRGTVRTARIYSDFVLRFEFRLPEPEAEGRLFVRSRFGYGNNRASERGYRIALTNRVDGAFYPREPFDAGVQGAVSLELVVDATGRAGDVRVLRSLHPDLDEAAIASARQWEFAPGTTAGQPVAVVVTMAVTFQLRK